MADEPQQEATTDFAEQLVAELDAAEKWPLPRERGYRERAAECRALRKQDRAWLKKMAAWDEDRAYLTDGLARRIAFGFADFLFADDLTMTLGDDELEDDGEGADDEQAERKASASPAQGELEDTFEQAQLGALFHRAERIIASEGEAWWKLHVNRAVSDRAILSFNSRLDVVPLFYGDIVLAVAFVTERAVKTEEYRAGDENPSEVVYRHFEIHTDGRVVNVLYRGLRDELGQREALQALPATAGYADEWPHGLPMLAGRVVNDLDDDPCQGEGEYGTVLDELLALNEAITIASENARLTGKDRIFSAGRFMQADGSFDASLEVFQLEDDGGTLGEDGPKAPITAVEKRYDAGPLWLHITNLVKTILSRVGLVPQWIGEETSGHADTGVAIRLKFIPTTNSAKGKVREWKRTAPRVLWLMLEIAALPVDQGGFGRSAVKLAKPPTVEFPDPIPADQSRDLLDVSAAVASEVMSRRTAILTLHPEWTEEQVEEEVALIEKEREAGVIAPALQPPAPVKEVEPPSSARGGGGEQ